MADIFAVFTPLQQTVDAALNAAMTGISSGWAGTMVLLISYSVALYIVCIGYQTLAGKIQAPLNDLFWKLGCTMLIIVFVDNSNTWFSLVSGAFEEIKNTLSGSLKVGSLDSILNMSADTLDRMVKQDKWWMILLEAPLFIAGILLFTLSAFMTLLLNEITFKITMGFFPIAIAALFHPATKGIFSGWINLLLSSTFTVMVLSIIIKMLTNFFTRSFTSTAENYLPMAIQVFVIGFFAGKFMGISVNIGRSLAAVSVDSAAAAMRTNQYAGRGTQTVGSGISSGIKYGTKFFGKKTQAA